MADGRQSSVTGEIRIGEETNTFSGATIYVYLEDVSLQDASSRIVAKQILTAASHQYGRESRIGFTLQSEEPDEKTSYSVRVHVAMHDAEEIRIGDFITMQSYPVLTFGRPNHVIVQVREVK